MYIYERSAWPQLTWDLNQLASLLAEVRYLQGHLLGRMKNVGFDLCKEATLNVLTQNVIKTSEIEGEHLNADSVRSSLAKRLGIEIGSLLPHDRHVDGIVDVTLDATRHYRAPLTKDRLIGWHTALFPTGRSGMVNITVGQWRNDAHGPMRVVSGAYGREKVHYEAPPHKRLEHEMKQFLKWIETETELDGVIKAALAHFWFVTIHPFDDGNGRIARAIADMMLARSEHSQQRFYSMSAQIQRERNMYYEILEQCQKGPLDITPWIDWFLHCLKRALLGAEKTLDAVLIKAEFWKTHQETPFNDRQRYLINRLMNGFEGKLNSSKWAKLAKCSQDTALRDIQDLLERKILLKENAGGRSTSYLLNLRCNE